MACRTRGVPLLAVGLALAIGASGCRLTGWLWSDPEPVTWVETTSVDLEAEATTGRLDGPVENQVLQVDFAPPVGNPSVPMHLRRYGPGRPGRLRMTPFARSANALQRLASSTTYESSSWELHAFNADYLQVPELICEVTLFGHVAPDELGVVVADADLPGELDGGPIPGRGEPRVDELLRGFDTHDWPRILAAPGTMTRRTIAERLRDEILAPPRRGRPIAWLDPAGTPIPAATWASRLETNRLEDCTLLASFRALTGETTWVRVPVHVLEDATNYDFERDGDRVQFACKTHWRGSLDAAPSFELIGLADLDVQLRGGDFLYEFGDLQVWDGKMLFDPVWKTLLTPVTAVLDVAAWSMPPLQRLLAYLAERYFPDGASRLRRR